MDVQPKVKPASLSQTNRAFGVPVILEGAPDFAAFLDRLVEIKKRVSAGKLPGISTGLKTLDFKLGGLQSGLHILAAEPGAGKTTLALQLCLQAAKTGGVALYFAFDESAERLAVKIAATLAGIRPSDLMSGKADLKAFEDSINFNRDLLSRVRIYGAPTINPTDIGAMIEELREISEADEVLIVIDFIQSLAGRLSQGSDYRVAVSELVGNLRLVAETNKVPILAISAQNRTGQGDAKMSSLRESSDLEYGADSISFLTTDESELTKEKRAVCFDCRKNRYGELFRADLDFYAAKGLFREK